MVRHGAGRTTKSVFKLGSLLRPHRRGGENGVSRVERRYAMLLESIRSNFPETFVGDTKAVLGLVMRVATPFIAKKRRQLWEANKSIILPLIRESIPPAAREFELYYTTHLLEKIADGFKPETWPPQAMVTEKLKERAAEVLPVATAEITTTNGELRDEELVRLHRAGYEKCRTTLLERHATKLHELTPRIVYRRNLCPSTEDSTQFSKDVAQDANLALLQHLDDYKFSDETVEVLADAVAEYRGGKRVNSIFGEGVNPRLRKIRDGLDLLGLDSDQMLMHGHIRIPVLVNYGNVTDRQVETFNISSGG
jgi:hypothetical protein